MPRESASLVLCPSVMYLEQIRWIFPTHLPHRDQGPYVIFDQVGTLKYANLDRAIHQSAKEPNSSSLCSKQGYFIFSIQYNSIFGLAYLLGEQRSNDSHN